MFAVSAAEQIADQFLDQVKRTVSDTKQTKKKHTKDRAKLNITQIKHLYRKKSTTSITYKELATYANAKYGFDKSESTYHRYLTEYAKSLEDK